MNKLISFILLLFLSITNVQAQQFDIFGKNQFSGTVSESPVEADAAFMFDSEILEDNKIKLSWGILDNYYLYDDKLEYEVGADSTIKVKELSKSRTDTKQDPLFGEVQVYHNRAEVIIQLKNDTNLKELANLKIHYQGCWEGGVCYPPLYKNIDVELKEIKQDVKEIKEVIQKPIERKTVITESSFVNILKDSSIGVIIGVFFIAGLALSFTPCVFPMIPILSSIIAGQGNDIHTKKAFILSLVYVLSIAITYTVAGVMAGLFGSNIQIILQNSYVIGSFSFIFVLLALSMFGFYELQLPNNIQSKLSNASNNQKGGTMAGVAVMGLLSALIVGPCMAAPLAGSLIYIGQTGDPLIGGLSLFSLSMGMGLPLLLIGTSAGHILPKAGAWMESVKSFFGVVLLLMAVYMSSRILPVEVSMLFVSAILVIYSIYLKLFETTKDKSNPQKFIKGVALLIFVYGLSLFIGVLSGNSSFTKPLGNVVSSVKADNKLNFTVVKTVSDLEKEIQNSNQPVILDFYADWCVACFELEAIFKTEEVYPLLQDKKLIKVDITDYNEESKALLSKYKVLGPPALIFYDKDKNHIKEKDTFSLIKKEILITYLKD